MPNGQCGIILGRACVHERKGLGYLQAQWEGSRVPGWDALVLYKILSCSNKLGLRHRTLVVMSVCPRGLSWVIRQGSPSLWQAKQPGRATPTKGASSSPDPPPPPPTRGPLSGCTSPHPTWPRWAWGVVHNQQSHHRIFLMSLWILTPALAWDL